MVLERDGYACAYCLCGAAWTCPRCSCKVDTVDHIIPKRQDGTDDPGNLVAACRSCNSRKGTGGVR